MPAKYYNYHGETLTLSEIAEREGENPYTALARRRSEPGKDWQHYMRRRDLGERVTVEGRSYTFAKLGAMIGKHPSVARQRYMAWSTGRITTAQLFSEENLGKERSNKGSAEWQALGNDDRSHNLTERVGTWERDNISEPRRKLRKRVDHTIEIADSPVYYPGQFRFSGL